MKKDNDNNKKKKKKKELLISRLGFESTATPTIGLLHIHCAASSQIPSQSVMNCMTVGSS